MITLRWFLLAVVAFAGGFFVVQYMVRPTDQIGLYAVLLVLVLAGIFFLLIKNFKGLEIAIASLLVMVGFVGGYMVANAAFLAQEEATRIT